MLSMNKRNPGFLEAGEGGIGDIGVDLLDSAGNIIASTVSNHDGYYIFQEYLFMGQLFLR